MRKTLRYVLCDVFTDRPLAGNALAVFTDAREIDGETMQALARELNLAETAFILPKAGAGDARLRIFTPTRELPCSGHPTLGAAFVLAAPLQRPHVTLEVGPHLVPISLEGGQGPAGFCWMVQPRPTVARFYQPDALLAALGLNASALPIEVYDTGVRQVIVALPPRASLAAVQPDRQRLAALPLDTVSIFAGDNGVYETRVFVPGTPRFEDPATGSAAGPLGWHLVRHEWARPEAELRIHQGAAVDRPSTLHVCVRGPVEAPTSIEVGGHVVLVARGQFVLP